MKSISVIFVLAALFVSSCATKAPQSDKPDWIDGDSASYPAAQYLVGRGMAATRQEAEDRARADLAKIFEVKVTVASEDIQGFETGTDGTGQGRYQGQSSRSITTHTDRIISGIRIAELWEDPATRQYHTLAVLSRLQTMASLRQQIGELDDATGKYIEQSRSNSDLFLKIAPASQAVEAQRQRQELQKSLQILDASGIGAQARWNIAELDADLGELLRRVKIALRVPDDVPPGLAGIVAGALANAGFMADTGTQPDFVLQASMDLHDAGLQDGWYWQRGNLEVILSEAGNGRVRGSKRWPIKSSAQDRKISINRALSEADTLLKQGLRAAIIDMINSPVPGNP